MTIRFPKDLFSEFKKRAKEMFPREKYAILMGKRVSKDFWAIEALWFPEGADDYCTKFHVTVLDSWWEEAKKVAAEQKLELLGDIHSHTHTKPFGAEASAADFDASNWVRRFMRGAPMVFGVVAIYQTKAGKRARLRFWPGLDPIEVKF